MYCGIHVYEKLDGMSAWLLGFIALRELLLFQQFFNLGFRNGGNVTDLPPQSKALEVR